MQTFSFLLRTEVSVESLMQHKLYCLLLKRSIKTKKRSKRTIVYVIDTYILQTEQKINCYRQNMWNLSLRSMLVSINEKQLQ